jgi:hypothetical protein
LEVGFANLESKFSELLVRLKDHVNSRLLREVASDLRQTDRATLCEYLFTQMIRVPRTFDWIKDRIHAESLSIKQEFGVGLEPEIEQQFSVLTLVGLGKDGYRQAYSLLMQRNTRIEVFPRTRTTLLSSDNPVIRISRDGHGGLQSDQTHVLFPLDQRMLLRLSGTGDTIEAVRNGDLTIADDINRLLISSAQDEVYCASPEYLIELLRRSGVEATVRK